MDVKKELEIVERKISKIAVNYVDTRGRAQIANLQDKVQTREKMPNFISEIETTVKIEGVEHEVCIEVDMLTFLQSINTEVPEENRKELKGLEKRKIALKTLLDCEGSGDKKEGDKK